MEAAHMRGLIKDRVDAERYEEWMSLAKQLLEDNQFPSYKIWATVWYGPIWFTITDTVADPGLGKQGNWVRIHKQGFTLNPLDLPIMISHRDGKSSVASYADRPQLLDDLAGLFDTVRWERRRYAFNKYKNLNSH